jgi:hypothetical protein
MIAASLCKYSALEEMGHNSFPYIWATHRDILLRSTGWKGTEKDHLTLKKPDKPNLCQGLKVHAY